MESGATVSSHQRATRQVSIASAAKEKKIQNFFSLVFPMSHNAHTAVANCRIMARKAIQFMPSPPHQLESKIALLVEAHAAILVKTHSRCYLRSRKRAEK
ncbi:hypothetical protein HRbin09_01196 [bacterium HR09]|nr:hypothetical protein HRbin09_01196 [bacterium HR09]